MEEDNEDANSNGVRDAASQPRSDANPDGGGDHNAASRPGAELASASTNQGDEGTLVLEPPQPYQFQSHSPAELPLPEATPKAQKACKAAQPADQSNPASSVIDTLSGTLIIGEATG